MEKSRFATVIMRNLVCALAFKNGAGVIQAFAGAQGHDISGTMNVVNHLVGGGVVLSLMFNHRATVEDAHNEEVQRMTDVKETAAKEKARVAKDQELREQNERLKRETKDWEKAREATEQELTEENERLRMEVKALKSKQL